MKSCKINPVPVTACLALGIGLGSPQLGAASYADYIAASNPVAWWGMNETGGPDLATTADLSGAYGAANNQAGVNLNMTYQGAGTNTLTDQEGFVSGAANRAAYFDGSSTSGAYAHGATPYDLAVEGAIYRYEPGGFAGEVWVKPELVGGGLDAQRVFATREFGFGFEDTNPLHRLQFTTFGKQDYFSTTSIPIDGNWHQIGFSYDGNVTTTFYIDGVDAGTHVGASAGIRTALSPGANTMNLGHRNTDLQHFKGTLDEAVLWGAPRSAADFAASYAAAVPGAGSAFDTWATSQALTGPDAAFDADPDKDGLSNGIEFVIGGQPNPANPNSDSSTLLHPPVASGNSLVFTFTRANEAAYLNPSVEFATGLPGVWITAADPGNATIAVTPGDPSATVTVTIPKGTNSTMFARLKVVQP